MKKVENKTLEPYTKKENNEPLIAKELKNYATENEIQESKKIIANSRTKGNDGSRKLLFKK